MIGLRVTKNKGNTLADDRPRVTKNKGNTQADDRPSVTTTEQRRRHRQKTGPE